MTLKLGKKPARPGAVKLQFSDYVTPALPPIPKFVGKDRLPHLPSNLGMLGNDQYGDCYWAGAAHETMSFAAEQMRAVVFSDQAVLSDYAAQTGFNPGDPNSDQGTDMQEGASYRRKVGIEDANGQRHTVDAYVALKPGSISQLRMAIHLFGAVGVGVRFPGFWMDRFNRGQEWVYRSGADIEGGHYVPAFASTSTDGAIIVATWGRLQRMSAAAYRRYCDEAVAYISLERLDATGVSIEGFKLDQLLADLRTVTQLPG